MDENDLDAVVASIWENVTYLSDFSYRLVNMWRTTQIYAVLPRQGEPALIVPVMGSLALAETPTWIADVRIYGRFPIVPPAGQELAAGDAALAPWLDRAESSGYTEGIQTLVAVLRDRGLAHGRIGVDEGHMTPELWQRLQAGVPGARLVPAYDLFRAIRMVKTPEEIRRLEEAAHTTERAIKHSAELLREGVSEQELLDAYLTSLVNDGALPGSFLIAVGSRTGAFLPISREARLLRGDIIKYDVGCIKNEYWADMARTMSLGTPNEKARTYYRALHDAHLESMAAIRPGMTVSEVFHRSVNAVRRNGLTHYTRPHVGHGIGVEYYDPPMLRPPLSPGDPDTTLEENMVLCFEHPYYEVGFGGLSVEDTIVITENGVRSFTSLPRELWEI